MYVKDVEDIKTSLHRVYFILCQMSEMCTMSMNYNVDSNTKYSNYIEH